MNRYVFITKTESGGLFWRILFNRMLIAVFLGDIVIALVVRANGSSWVMLGVMAGLPFLIVAFKIYCARAFDDEITYLTKGKLGDAENATPIDKASRRGDRVASRFGHPALYKRLMRPMMPAKAKHLTDELLGNSAEHDHDLDTASAAGYSDVYNMRAMAEGKPGKSARGSGSRSEFEFVDDSDLDFENFKNHPDFRDEHGGGGVLYGGADDAIRPGTARTYTSQSGASDMSSRDRAGGFRAYHDRSRSESRDSERTLQEGGVTYPAGYHHTPGMPSRSYSPSPSPMDRQRSTDDILRAAAPMGVQTPSPLGAGGVSRKPVGTSSSGNTPAEEDTSYDYFRGRRL